MAKTICFRSVNLNEKKCTLTISFCKSCVCNCDGLLCIYFSICGSNKKFIYHHKYIYTLSIKNYQAIFLINLLEADKLGLYVKPLHHIFEDYHDFSWSVNCRILQITVLCEMIKWLKNLTRDGNGCPTWHLMTPPYFSEHSARPRSINLGILCARNGLSSDELQL